MKPTTQTTPAKTTSRRPYSPPRVLVRDSIDVLCGVCDSLWGGAPGGCRTAAICGGVGKGIND